MSRVITYEDIPTLDHDYDIPEEPERVDTPSKSQEYQLKRRIRAYVEAFVEHRGLWAELKAVGEPDEDGLPLGYTIETGRRWTRSGGKCTPYENNQTGKVTYCNLTFVWRFYAGMSWEKFTGIIRHELAHAVEYFRTGEGGHGAPFKDVAEELDAVTHIDNETWMGVFDHRYTVECKNCNLESPRNKASKPVKRPEQRMCPDCKTDTLVVHHNPSGKSWETYDKYQQVRSEVEKSEIKW